MKLSATRRGRSTPASTTTSSCPASSWPSSASAARPPARDRRHAARHADRRRHRRGSRRAFAAEPPAVVVVHGDTNATIAGALAANATNIPLVHVEAGLRSFDRAMPEEHNRVVADHLADLCCAPTETNRANLAAEGIGGDKVILTGNTVVDAATRCCPAPDERAALLGRHGLEPRRLRAVHVPPARERRRPRDAGGHPHRARPRSRCPSCCRSTPAPRPRSPTFGLGGLLKPLRVVEPIGYREFLALAAESALLVSDSGGVQEEASIVKRPVLVVRNSTERPEVLGTFAELVAPGPAIGERGREWAGDLAGDPRPPRRPHRPRTATVTRASASRPRSPSVSPEPPPHRAGVTVQPIGTASRYHRAPSQRSVRLRPARPQRAGPTARRGTRSLALEAARCCICGTREAEPVGVGEDFEYRTSPDSFLTVRCDHCGLVYLDPRPVRAELRRIYPDHYHAFTSPRTSFGFVYQVRRRLEARRLLAAAGLAPGRRQRSSTSAAATASTSTCSREFGQAGLAARRRRPRPAGRGRGRGARASSCTADRSRTSTSRPTSTTSRS